MEQEFIKYLKHFDSIFNTSTEHSAHNIQLLTMIYNRFEDELYTPTKERIKLLEARKEVSDRLDNTLTEEQKQLFQQYWELDSNIHTDTEQQLFVFGNIIVTELANEITGLLKLTE